ncbi:MAG: hypothetical protein AAFV43_04730 [Planctomycetota bacterium]
MRRTFYLQLAVVSAAVIFAADLLAARLLHIDEPTVGREITDPPTNMPLVVRARLADSLTVIAKIRVWKQEFNETTRTFAYTPVRSNQPYNSDDDGLFVQDFPIKEAETFVVLELDHLALAEGDHTLIVEARATDSGGRVSQVYTAHCTSR